MNKHQAPSSNCAEASEKDRCGSNCGSVTDLPSAFENSNLGFLWSLEFGASLQTALDIGCRGVVSRGPAAPGHIAVIAPYEFESVNLNVTKIVRWQAIFVIQRIQMAADLQLFQIVQTGDA